MAFGSISELGSHPWYVGDTKHHSCKSETFHFLPTCSLGRTFSTSPVCSVCLVHCPVSELCKDLFTNRPCSVRSSVIHGLQVIHGVGWSHFTEKVCCLHFQSERMFGVTSYWDRFNTSFKVPKIVAKQEMRCQFLVLWIPKHLSSPWK
jgi:hypothetical protein